MANKKTPIRWDAKTSNRASAASVAKLNNRVNRLVDRMRRWFDIVDARLNAIEDVFGNLMDHEFDLDSMFVDESKIVDEEE